MKELIKLLEDNGIDHKVVLSENIDIEDHMVELGTDSDGEEYHIQVSAVDEHYSLCSWDGKQICYIVDSDYPDDVVKQVNKYFQGNITKSKSLTKEVAKHICENIMGLKYSHHDNDTCYETHGDKHPMIYFYEGMSPSILKLNTVTGEVRHGTDTVDIIYDLIVDLKEKLSELGSLERFESDGTIDKVKAFRAKGEEVKEYLKTL